MHVAVKHTQLEIIKQLVNTYKANTQIKNKAGRTPEEMATKTIKDKNLLETIIKLVQKRTTSTKVDYRKEIR